MTHPPIPRVLDRCCDPEPASTMASIYVRAARAALGQPATHPADIRLAIKYLMAALEESA